MKEYIERGAALKVIEGIDEMLYSEVFLIPAADVAPVVRGYWFVSDESLCCSVCGKAERYVYDTDIKAGQAIMANNVPPRCAHCGAYMKEEQAND